MKNIKKQSKKMLKFLIIFNIFDCGKMSSGNCGLLRGVLEFMDDKGVVCKFILKNNDFRTEDYVKKAQEIFIFFDIVIENIGFEEKNYKFNRKASQKKITDLYKESFDTVDFNSKSGCSERFNPQLYVSFDCYSEMEYIVLNCVPYHRIIKDSDIFHMFEELGCIIAENFSIFSAYAFLYPLENMPWVFADGIIWGVHSKQTAKNIAQWINARTVKLRVLSNYNVIQYNESVFMMLSEFLPTTYIKRNRNLLFFKLEDNIEIEELIFTERYNKIYKELLKMEIVNECAYDENL
jgi:hypothetical protein